MSDVADPKRPGGADRVARQRELQEIDAELLRISEALLGRSFMPNIAVRKRQSELQATGTRIRAELGLPPDPRYYEPPDSASGFWILAATIAAIAAAISLLAWVTQLGLPN